jgi:hypothetical protein
MGKFQDLTGQRYGRLTVAKRAENRGKETMWLCLCDCGNQTIVRAPDLKRGVVISCGCWRSEKSKERALNLAGKRFGRLTVIDRAKNRGPRAFWNCVCDCGENSVVQTYQLVSGHTRSCGCLKKDMPNSGRFKPSNKPRVEPSLKPNKPHYSKERLYGVWKGMKARCYCPNASGYQNYGGRGITVCEDWTGNDGYLRFREWAYSHGYDDSASNRKCTLDRINANGNYGPDNCRWVDTKTQANNTRRNIQITVAGETHTRTEWAERLGVPSEAIRTPMRSGISGEEAVRSIMETQQW